MLTLPIVHTLLPVTFGYFLSSEAVIMRQLRRWKRLWRRSLTCSHKRTSMGPSRICWNSTTSGLQPEEIVRRGLDFHVCTINKSAHTKNSGNAFNDPRIILLRQSFSYIIFQQHWTKVPRSLIWTMQILDP